MFRIGVFILFIVGSFVGPTTLLAQGWRGLGIDQRRLQSEFLAAEQCLVGPRGSESEKFSPEALYVSCLWAYQRVFEKMNRVIAPKVEKLKGAELEQSLASVHVYLLPEDYRARVDIQRQAFSLWQERAEKLASFENRKQDVLSVQGDLNPLVGTWMDQGQLDEEKFVQSALNGILVALFDDHSRIEPIEGLQREGGSTVAAEFAGVGIILGEDRKRVKIHEVIPGRPADLAGVQRGDEIIKIDGQDITLFESTDEVVGAIKGVVGTAVELTVKRKSEVLKIKITREKMKASGKSVFQPYLNSKKYGMIRVPVFSENVCADFTAEVKALTEAGVSHLIIDLRGNPGGRVDQATCMADIFLERGQVITGTKPYQRGVPETDQYDMAYISRWEKLYNSALVILIDGSSASASELFSGALADQGRAIVIGSQSFGKGVTQSLGFFCKEAEDKYCFPEFEQDEVFGLPDVKITLTRSRFYQPLGETNHFFGVTPHLMLEGPSEDSPFFVESDYREEHLMIHPVPAIGKKIERELPSSISSCLADSRRVKDHTGAYDGSDEWIHQALKVAQCMEPGEWYLTKEQSQRLQEAQKEFEAAEQLFMQIKQEDLQKQIDEYLEELRQKAIQEMRERAKEMARPDKIKIDIPKPERR